MADPRDGDTDSDDRRMHPSGVDGVEAALTQLETAEDWEDRHAQEEMRWEGWTAVVDPLVERLAAESERTRRRAATALGWVGDADAVDPLVGRLRADDAASVREAAAVALGAIGEPGETAVDELAAAVERESFTAAAAGAVAACGGVERAVDIVERHDDAAVRRAVLTELASSKRPESVAPVVEVLYGGTTPQREAAAHALRWTVGPAATDERGEAGLSERARVALVTALDDDAPAVRATAAESLGNHLRPGPSADPPRYDRIARALADVLRDADEPAPVRVAAASSLTGHAAVVGRARHERLLDAVTGWLGISGAAATVDDPVVRTLIAALDDDHAEVATAAADALGRYVAELDRLGRRTTDGEPTDPVLAALVGTVAEWTDDPAPDSDPAVAAAAARSLRGHVRRLATSHRRGGRGNGAPDPVLGALLAALDAGPPVTGAATRSLVTYVREAGDLTDGRGERVATALVEALPTVRAETRRSVAVVLGGDPPAEPSVEAALRAVAEDGATGAVRSTARACLDGL